MTARVLDCLQIFNLIKEEHDFKIDSLKISANLRLFLKSTKEKGIFLHFTYKQDSQHPLLSPPIGLNLNSIYKL